MPRKAQGGSSTKALQERLVRSVNKLSAELASNVGRVMRIAGAGQFELLTQLLGPVPLDKYERRIVAGLPALTEAGKRKLTRSRSKYTVGEVTGMILAVADLLPDAETQAIPGLLIVSRKLMQLLREHGVFQGIARVTKKSKPASRLFQFKITLLGSEPPIWRRIQVQNCTLDKLHEHIQTSMGWTNSHLHDFAIGEQLYGDPMLMQEDFGERGYRNSRTTRLSEVIPIGGKRLRFLYRYDFGDGWDHEVLFEGSPEAEAGRKYPVCLEGERACPPEDVGGLPGYANFVEAIKDPNHEEHDDLLNWAGGAFDPERFDAVAATRAMKKGLPDWRNMI